MCISEINEYLQGHSYKAYKVFGSHIVRQNGKNGIKFTVYAPEAMEVFLIADFNNWQPILMKKILYGIWTLFVEGNFEGSYYKYKIKNKNGHLADKIDPFAFYSELRPGTASRVYNIKGFKWTDKEYMKKRYKNFDMPLSIYEVHLGSWKIKNKEKKTFYTYREMSKILIPYVKEKGFTHIELMPINEYPFDGSWGYQISGFFSATSRYGEPKDLMYFIDKCHKEGIGVIFDFVPGHFVKDYSALYEYDGSHVFESEYDDKSSSEWGTAIFDYTKPHVISFLKSSINFFITYFHFDGVRYDAVSNMVYVDGDINKGINESGVWFLKNLNYEMQMKHPRVMYIAEDSSIYNKVTKPVIYGGLGFDYKWCFGWMHDSFQYFMMPQYEKRNNRNKLMFSMHYFYNENYLLPISHDEVSHYKNSVINKMNGTYEEKFSLLRCFYLYMFTHPGKKLNFMGNEFAQFDEWKEDRELCWNLYNFPKHNIFSEFFKDLQNIYRNEKSLYKADYNKGGFSWIYTDKECVFIYKRDSLDGDAAYVVLNLSNTRYDNLKVIVDDPYEYYEIINTDDKKYDGSGVINHKIYTSKNGEQNYILINIAKMSGSIIKKKQY
ncbi:1,4-alpha-glucan branching protein GlgB [Clostridium sp. BJN0001]|uniref:1,4-alpha-glucan branching protein GlgB n=1 Tax=Clostridium sp. BJN0001 TaxID=2930219 RepID=UPI001FD1EAF7|nr:1,4-alpha-glucan branching protein GlgB [Clostridium sp. BJN0001]